MRNKGIKSRLIDINDLRNECGFAYSKSSGDGFDCKSKSKEASGKCYERECPLAYQADLAALKELDYDLYLEWLPKFQEDIKTGRSEENCYIEDSWMVQHSIKGQIGVEVSNENNK